jgi:hypothetical protein
MRAPETAPFDRSGTSPRSGKDGAADGHPRHRRRPDHPPPEERDPSRRPRATSQRVGDRRRGASSPRINSARWRRRRVSVGPVRMSWASNSASIRGSATASGRLGVALWQLTRRRLREMTEGFLDQEDSRIIATTGEQAP